MLLRGGMLLAGWPTLLPGAKIVHAHNDFDHRQYDLYLQTRFR